MAGGVALGVSVSVGQWVLVVAVVVAVGFGAWRRVTDGRFAAPTDGTRAAVGGTGTEGRGPMDAVDPADAADAAGAVSAPGGHERVSPAETITSVVAGTPFADELGERATFLQFSSAFCAPCRVTRRTLGEVTDLIPGVAHVEVDAEQHLELVRRVNILRTPTTLVLDAQGREVTRASGAPTKAQVLSALALVLPAE